jgi:hypothetical protein
MYLRSQYKTIDQFATNVHFLLHMDFVSLNYLGSPSNVKYVN